MRQPLLTLVALGALLAPMTLHAPQAQAATAAPTVSVASGPARVIVRLKETSSLLRRQALAASDGDDRAERVRGLSARVGRAMRAGGAVDDRTQLVFADGVASAQLAAELARQSDVEYAVVDQRRRRAAVPNDPLYATGGAAGPVAGQWYLKPPSGAAVAAIDAQSAWDVTVGSPSIVVAVLDTGIRFEHPDLLRTTSGGNLLPGYDFVADAKTANDGNGRDADASDPGDWVTQADKDNDPDFKECDVEASSWHGTQTAGLIGALTNNNLGIASVGRTVRILPVRVLGKCGGFDSDIIPAMRWAAGISVPGVPDNTTPAKVINLSLGGDGTCNSAYTTAIAEVNARGTVVVASAGNSSGHAVAVPASCPGVIAVSGLRHVGTKVGFADIGPEITLSAPAGNCVNTDASQPCLFPIPTTSNSGSQGPMTSIWTDGMNDVSLGTSFSAPLVAGTAALMLSVRPSMTPAEVKAMLQGTARIFPTTGGDNADGSQVLECTAPQFDGNGTAVDQAQCYCTTGTCGAGMLDAGAAVRAASANTTQGAHARIDISPAAPVAGSAVQLAGTNSTVAGGRQIVMYQWSLLDGGGIVTTLGNPTSPTATAVPSASGKFKVRLTVQDSGGTTSTSDLTMVVNSTPPPPPPPAADSGGGGALGLPWLILLAIAIPALRVSRRRGH